RIVTVAPDDIVPSGAKITLNEAVAEGCKTSGSAGRFPNVKNAPEILMELTVRGTVPELVSDTFCVDDVVTGTTPKTIGLGATVITIEDDVTVKPLARVSDSNPVDSATDRVPGKAAESILRTAVALVRELTVRETTVIPVPKLIWLVPCKKCVN